MTDNHETAPLARWRLWAAMGVLVVLAALLALVAQRSGSDDEAASGETTVTPSTTTASSVTEPPSTTEASGTVEASDDPILEQVDAALDAWAAFASSGDPVLLEGTFHPDGPQHAQLVEEVGALTGSEGGSYAFDIVTADVASETPDTAIIASTLGFSRPDGTRFEYDWDIEMRQSDTEDRWLLWTVTTRQ